MENQRYKLAQIPVDIIDYNCGQIQGLKPNPREIDLQHLDKLKKQITEYPEMLEYRGLMVYKSGGGICSNRWKSKVKGYERT